MYSKAKAGGFIRLTPPAMDTLRAYPLVKNHDAWRASGGRKKNYKLII